MIHTNKQQKKIKSILECNKKISELNQDTDSLQKYKNKLLRGKVILSGILRDIAGSNLVIENLINSSLSSINQGLQLPRALEQRYKPNFIDKLKILGVLTYTKKTFNEVKSAINEINMELQQVYSQINSMNHQ